MEEREDKSILLYGLFDAQVKLTSLIDQVRREGVHDDAIEVISPVPQPISAMRNRGGKA